MLYYYIQQKREPEGVGNVLKILICEDEKDWADYMEGLIHTRLEKDSSVTICHSGKEIYETTEKADEFDVALMDICLKDANGIAVAKDLQKKYPDVKIIFISGYVNEYLEGLFLKVRPYGILRKPLDEEICVKMLEKAWNDKKAERGIALKLQGGKVRNLRLKDIYYLESDKRIVIVHLKDGEEKCYERLDNIQERLPSSFLRCHKSFLVNMDKISSFQTKGVELLNGAVIDVSRTRMKETKTQYFQYIGMEL